MKQLKNRYRLFRRGWGVYYAFNNETGNSESLKSRDKAEATRLVHAMNEAARLTQLNMQIARADLLEPVGDRPAGHAERIAGVL